MAYELSKDKYNNGTQGITEYAKAGLFTTAELTRTEKVDFWREVVCNKVVPLDFNVEPNDSFEGNLRWTQIGDIHLSDIKATPHVALRTLSTIKHSGSDSLIFNLLLSGQCNAEQDGISSQLSAVEMHTGMGWLCNAARPYDLRFDQPFHLATLQIPRHMITQNISGVDRLVARNLSSTSQLFPLVQNYILQLAEQRPQFDKAMSERVANNLADLISALLGEHLSGSDSPLSDTKIATLMRVRSFIESNLHDPDLCPNKVAEAMRMSTRYINQLLQSEGTSLSRYIWQRRLDRVSRLLKNPVNQGNNISSYAFACGFNDMTHFSKAFKKQFGMSPSEYRQRYLS
ncbi:MAG: helix-turn-helix domain-containing protein [Oceanospirillales bacterium]|nr:helix-turn-helix domain-containing protein [Oceanospirillales bacterium]